MDSSQGIFKGDDKDLQNIKIPEIRKAIEFAQRNYRIGAKSNHVVLFWGYSGTGKSTSIIVLNGQQMYAYNGDGTPILINRTNDSEKQEIQEKGKIVIFIQTKMISGTVYPAVLPMKELTKNQESISMWDSPGFGENRGITQILINLYFIHRIFNIQNQIKLVFTINFNDLASYLRGANFKRVATTLTETLKNFPNYNTCMALLVTRVTSLGNLESIKKLLIQNLQLLLQSKNPELQRFYKIIKSDTMPIFMIRQPQVNEYNTKDNPRYVNQHEYQQFTKTFYELVTTKLKNAQSPCLLTPEIKVQQLKKCGPFADTIKNNIETYKSEFISNLKQSIRKNYANINIDSFKTFDVQCTEIGQKKQFIAQLMDLVKFSSINKNQLKNKLQVMERLLIQYKIPVNQLQNLKNEFIIVDFLFTLKLNQKLGQKFSWISYESVVKQFLNKINSDTQFTKIFEVGDNNVKSRIKNEIRMMLGLSVQIERQQQFFFKWQNNIKTLPSLYLLMTKYNKNKDNFGKYLQEVSDVYAYGDNKKCQATIQDLKSKFESSKKNGKLVYNEKELIAVDAIPTLKEKFQLLIGQNLKYQEYTNPQISRINFNIPLNQMNKNHEKSIKEKDDEIKQKNSEIESLQTQLAIAKKCCCQIM